MTLARFHGTRAAVFLATMWISCGALAASGCLATFTNPQDRYPSDMAQAGAPSPLPWRAAPALDALVGPYLDRYCVTGFLVMKNGEVVFERYLQGTRGSDKLLADSMSETVLALLAGIAVTENRIAPEDRVAAVLPDFKDSGFADSSLEDLLRMSTGAKLPTQASGEPKPIDPIASPATDVRAYLRAIKDRTGAPGRTFTWDGAQYALVGLMLAERVKMPLNRYLEVKLWRPLGAEDSAYWMRNRAGQDGVQNGFAATLRDYARLGALMGNHGVVQGRSVVVPAWIDRMMKLRTDKPQPSQPPYYGMGVWIPRTGNGRAFGWGNNGQYLYVDPVAKVVIVHLAASPNVNFEGDADFARLRDTIVDALK